MITFPTCKINLGLHILFKRNDGYHELETAMLELPMTDILEIIESNRPSFETSGIPIPLGENLCQKAEKLLRNEFQFPDISVFLHKNIPLGGGLAGGSSDAVFLLKLINEKFQLKIEKPQLLKLAAELGSDCAFFVDGGFQICQGRGEIVHSIDHKLSNYHVVLINLGIHISTQIAFSNVLPNNKRNSVQSILDLPIKSWKENLKNDFENSVFPKYPELAKLKEVLYSSGAIYASMSGSGSTLFGIFKNEKDLNLTIPENGFIRWVKIP